jgi:ribosomal protein S18 acetylase RimI-like enzyme
MGVEIRLARPSDAVAIGSVFARAFAGDPVTSWVTPDAARRARVLRRMNTAIARYEGVPRGATYVAIVSGEVVGAAIWQPPGARVVTWRGVPFALMAGQVLGRDMGRMIAAGRAAARARPGRPHWYLQLLGVDPDAQGDGVGGLLVREGLRVVEESGVGAHLETTEENVGFYRQLGFVVRGEFRVGREGVVEYSMGWG